MIVVLAHRRDPSAEELVSWWPKSRLMTPRDLSTRGWSHGLSGTVPRLAVIGGEIRPVEEIEAVYTRLTVLTDDDVPGIVVADRTYVAKEMTAFLLSWLSSLPCPVVNRPSPLGLAGPNLRREAWVRLAHQAGMPAIPVARGADGYEELETKSYMAIAVVGRRALGCVPDDLRDRALRLAGAAGLELMTALFDMTRTDRPLIVAEPWVDTRSPLVADATYAYLTSAALRRQS
jgi:hypothetical protein